MFIKNFKKKNKNGERFQKLQCQQSYHLNKVVEDLQKLIKVKHLYLNNYNNLDMKRVIWIEEFKVSQQVRNMSKYLLKNIQKAKLQNYEDIKGDKFTNDKDRIRSKSDLSQQHTNYNFYSDFQARQAKRLNTDMNSGTSEQKFDTNFLKFDEKKESKEIGKLNKYQKVDFTELNQVNFDTLTEQDQQKVLNMLDQDTQDHKDIFQNQKDLKQQDNTTKDSNEQIVQNDTTLNENEVDFLNF